MRISLYVSALAAVALTGCGGFGFTAPTRVLGESVSVPIAVPCIVEVPSRPELLADAAWASSADEFVKVRALMADRAILKAHVGTLEAVLLACMNKEIK